MDNAIIWSGGLAALSGAGMGVAGTLLLPHAKRRPQLAAFGVFLIGWGAQGVLANTAWLLAAAGEPSMARSLLLVQVALMMASYVPLVRALRSTPPTRLGWALLVAPLAMVLVALAAAPRLFHAGFAADLGSKWGPLYLPAFLAHHGSILVCVARLHVLRGRETSPGLRRRLELVVLALCLYVAYWSSQNVIVQPARLGAGRIPWGAPLHVAVLLAALAGLALCAVVVRAGVREGHAAQTRLGIFVPCAFGVVSAFGSLSVHLPGVETLGVWRLASAGLLSLAFLRYERADLDARLARAVRWAAVVTLGVAAASVLIVSARWLSIPPFVLLLVAAVGLAMALFAFQHQDAHGPSRPADPFETNPRV